MGLIAPSDGDDWLGISSAPLPVGEAVSWSELPRCGAVVLFSGIARDHAEGRDDVDVLEYEAYEEQVVPRLESLAVEIRRRWPAIGRLVMVHRVGTLDIGDSAVVVVASAPHRPDAFAAARFGIDAIKATIPIWKRERWSGGDAWGTDAQHIREIDDLSTLTVGPDGTLTLPPATK